MRCLARRGRLVTCGGTTGPEVSLLLPHLFMKNLSVLGSTMGPRRALPTIVEKVRSGAYRSTLTRFQGAGEVLGKIVLLPGS